MDEHDTDVSEVNSFLLFLVQEAKAVDSCPLETCRTQAPYYTPQACSAQGLTQWSSGRLSPLLPWHDPRGQSS